VGLILMVFEGMGEGSLPDEALDEVLEPAAEAAAPGAAAEEAGR
jgi:hypothetical protein